jgi:HD-GYP domain-containing protein (c-di-GMP phosphodiesterase class II)
MDMLDQPSDESVSNVLDRLEPLQWSNDAIGAVEHQLITASASVEVVRRLLSLSGSYYNSARSDDAIRLAELARSRAGTLGERAMQRRAASVLGAVLLDSARYRQAAEVLSEALQLARESGQCREQAPVLNNIATLLRILGQLQGALTVSRKVLELCGERVDLGTSPLVAASNALDVALALRDPSLVQDLLYRKTPPGGVDALADSPVQAAVFFSNRARLFILLNDVDRAQCDLHQMQSESTSTRLRYLSDSAKGVVDCAIGRPAAGLALLEQVKESTKTNGSMYHDVLAACAEGAEIAGRPDRALRYLKDLAELQRKRANILAELPLEVRRVAGDEQCHGPQVLANTISQLQGVAERHLYSLICAAIDSAVASGHDLSRCFRVGRLAYMFAAELGMTEAEAEELEIAGRVFDVGMMAIPSSILLKSRGLSAGEAAIVQEHSRYGSEIIRQVRLDSLEIAAVVARSHHEHWNGAGYPDRLSGDEIPLAARIVAICDSFDAMTQSRPHRSKAVSVPAALREITGEIGRKFDPKLVQKFVGMIQSEFWKHDELKEFLASDAHENQYVLMRQRLDRLIASSMQ